MFVSLLPGLRDLRTPLATGYVLLLALYLCIRDSLTHAVNQRDTLPGDLHTLVAAFGSGVGLVGISFAAYLLGALWVETFPSVFLRIHRWLAAASLSRRQLLLARWFDLSVDRVAELTTDRDPQQMTTSVVREVVMELLLGRYSEDDDFRRHIEAQETRLDPERALLKLIDVTGHVRHISAKVTELPPRLLGKEPEIWSAWDRLEAEADFRLATATALAALWGALATQYSLLWLAAIAVCAAFWRSGLAKRRDALSVLLQSVRSGRVLMPEIEALRGPAPPRWTKPAPMRGPQPQH
jgi:hypothetical protein